MKIKKIIKNYISLYNQINNDILIYQMGKVGSSTIESALIKSGLTCSHIHSFTGKNSYSTVPNLKVLYLSKFLLRFKKRKVITIVREPVSRNISTFFQELHSSIYNNIRLDNRAEKSLDVMLMEMFKADIRHDYPDQWFKEELQEIFNIDIFQSPYIIGESNVYNNERCELLILRMEDLDNSSQIISDFVGKDIEIERSNSSDRKWYAEMYKDFKSSIPQDYVEKCLSLKVASHFYSNEERESILRKYN